MTTQTKTKRKRSNGTDGERPAKRVMHENTAKAINVSLVSDAGEWTPLVANSPGISLPTTTSFKAYKKPRGNDLRSLSEILLHSAAHPAMVYTAQEEESFSTEKLWTHYIGVFNPETEKLQLFPSAKVTIRGTPHKIIDETSEENEDSLTQLSGRAALGLAFGTKKAQKAIRALTENAISPARHSSKSSSKNPILDLAANAVLDAMDGSAPSALAREQEKHAIEEAKPGPKPHMQAETPADVYPLEELVGLDVLRVLPVRDWQESLEADEDILTTSRFVSGRMRATVSSGNVRIIKALKYLLLLVQWYHCLKPGPRGTKKLPSGKEMGADIGEIREDLREEMRRRFADGNRLSTWHISNLQIHICALALVIDNFATDTHDLAQDLRLQPGEIRKLFTYLGCTVTPPTIPELTRWSLTKADAASHKVARLTVPWSGARAKGHGRKSRYR